MNIDISYIVIVIMVILISMTFHEAMHAYAGHWLGDSTAKDEGRLTLNPLAHIDPFLTLLLPISLAMLGLPIFGGAKPVPFNPYRVRYGSYGAALVAVAGPLTNLLFSFLFFAAFVFIQPSSMTPMHMFLTAGVTVNLGFFIFNMFPIPPLDGSRVLYALLPESLQKYMEFVERQGLLLVFALILIFNSFIAQAIMSIMTIILNAYATLFGVNLS